VELEARGSEWWAKVGSIPEHEEWIIIDAKTGAMHAESPLWERARKRGRHRPR
jgi:hypothetical protein